MARVKVSQPTESAPADRGRKVKWFGLVVVIVAIDLGTKWAATLIAADGDWGIVAPRENPDFSLGILPTDAHPLVLVLLLGAVTIVAAHAYRLTRNGALPHWASALLVGGAAGNLVDRLMTGAVHDWLHLGYVIANVADFALVIGIAAYVRAAWKAADVAESATS